MFALLQILMEESSKQKHVFHSPQAYETFRPQRKQRQNPQQSDVWYTDTGMSKEAKLQTRKATYWLCPGMQIKYS